MNGLKDLVGRRLEIKCGKDGELVPVRELPSATWFHSDWTITPVELPDAGPISYCAADIEFVNSSGPPADRSNSQTTVYICPHCRSKGFLREKDGRCSFCSGRENGVCINCGEPCLGDVCEWCGKDQSLENTG